MLIYQHLNVCFESLLINVDLSINVKSDDRGPQVMQC